MTELDKQIISPIAEDANDTSLYKWLKMIFRESSVFFIGTLFATAIAYLFKIYISRTLGASAVGIFTIGMSIVVIVQIVVSSGLSNAAVRFVPEYTAQRNWEKLQGFIVYGLIVVVVASFIFSLGLFLMRDWVATRFFDDASMGMYVLPFVILIPIQTTAFFVDQLIRGFKRVSLRTIVISFVQPVIRVILVLLLIGIGFNVFGYFWGSVFSAFISLLLLGYILWRYLPKEVKRPQKSIHHLDNNVLHYAKTLTFIGLLGFTAGQLNALVLGWFLPPGDVGIYSVAVTTSAFVPLVLVSVNSIIAPILSDIYAKSQLDLLQSMFKSITKWIINFSMPLIIFMCIFSVQIMGIFGEEFRSGWAILVILVLGQLINVGVGPAGLVLQMTGRQNYELIAIAISAGINLTLSVLLIPRWGLLGVGGAQALGLGISNFLRLYFVDHVFQFTPYSKDVLKLLGPVSVTILFATLLKFTIPEAAQNNIIFLCLIAVSMVFVYFVFILLIGLDNQDRHLISIIRSNIGSRRK